MSPEQATGSELDARCDLYAVGIILYQLTTGELPFDGGNSMEILTRQVNEAPMPPRQRAPQAAISAEMEQLILRAMDKEPSGRPQSASEFRRLLLALHAPSGSSLTPQELSQRPTAIRTPAVTATQPANEGPTPVPPARSSALRWVALCVGMLGAIGLSLFVARRQAASPADAELSKLPKLSNSINSAPGAAGVPTADDRAKSASLVEQAHQLQREGDTASARDLLEQALKADPDNARAHYSLGSLYLHTQPSRARAQYDLAVKLDAATYAAQVALIESTLPPADPGEQRDR
jgi:tetratricopeptide (TPR) repeat protein